MTPIAPPGRLSRRGLLPGAVAGAASALVFTAVHDLLISDIWATLPLMLGAGAACGLSLGWTYHLLVARPTVASWVRYNLLFIALFVGLGAVSVWVFEPVTTMAEVVAANEPPTELFRQALPMTAAFTLGMAGVVHLGYGRGPRHLAAILATCVLLVLLLGLNVSAIGLVALPRGSAVLIAEMFGLIGLLGAVYAAVFVGLERRRFWGPLAVVVALAAGGPASAQPSGSCELASSRVTGPEATLDPTARRPALRIAPSCGTPSSSGTR